MTIKEAIAESSLRISEVSEQYGIPYRTVQNWVAGTSSPPEWAERLLVEKIIESKKAHV